MRACNLDLIVVRYDVSSVVEMGDRGICSLEFGWGAWYRSVNQKLRRDVAHIHTHVRTRTHTHARMPIKASRNAGA